MKLKGRISITRPSYSNGKEVICIELDDDRSHCRVIEVELGYADFTRALMGQGYIPCEFEVYPGGIKNLGKVSEVKTVSIGFDDSPGRWVNLNEEKKNEILSNLEVDGWTFRNISSDFDNYHRRKRAEDGWYISVVMQRFVNKTGDIDATIN